MRILYISIFLFTLGTVKGQNSLKGKVVNQNNDGISNVLIAINNKTNSSSNDSGYFVLKFNEKQTICFSHLNYIDTCLYVNVLKDTFLIVTLNEKSFVSEQVVISTNTANKQLKSIQTGFIELKTENYRNIPSIAGEADPLRVLQMTPGVAKTDINMGLNVRGGSTDQNLVLLDDAVIYNPTHLAGFLSVFNSNALDKIQLYKSGIPSYFGGRLSSVTEVITYKSIPDSLKVTLNSGALLSGLSIKYPFLNKKAAVFISARKSYIDYTIKPISSVLFPQKRSLFTNTKYGFGDLNLGITLAPTINDRISISSYFGNDNFSLLKASFDVKNIIDWGNTGISARWSHTYANKHIMRTIAYYSSNYFDFFMGQNDFNFYLQSNINEYSIQHDHSFYFKNWSLKAGFQAVKQKVDPNHSKAELSDFRADFGTPNNFNTISISPFIHSEIEINKKIGLAIGLRSTYYAHLGPYYKFIRENGMNISDTIKYEKNSTISSFKQFEPRFSFRYLLDSITSLKLSASRNVQFLHQVNVSAVALPIDFWLPTNNYIGPEYAYQISAGYFKNFDNGLNFSIEAFYKTMENLPEFNSGVMSSVSKASMEENLLIGKGRAYGIEFFINGKLGKYNGWISYTLSRTTRIFKLINNGSPFPAKYDRAHDLSVLVQRILSKKWSVSSVFIIASGNAITLPNGRYLIEGNIINQYSAYNSFRMPTYHRLDIAFTRHLNNWKYREQNLNFSIYNVYSRLNPYYMYYSVEGNLETYKLKVKPKLVSIFPMIPSITYEIKF